jgi:hypothetical protein
MLALFKKALLRLIYYYLVRKQTEIWAVPTQNIELHAVSNCNLKVHYSQP